jgi:hypothetical protein
MNSNVLVKHMKRSPIPNAVGVTTGTALRSVFPNRGDGDAVEELVEEPFALSMTAGPAHWRLVNNRAAC